MSAPRRLTDEERLFRKRLRAREYQRTRLKAKPCEICGAEPAECHHIDYSDPERVMWLCTTHHKQTHSQFGRPAPEWMADIRTAVKRIEDQRRAIARSRPAQSE